VASRERAVAVVARPRSGGSQLLGGMQCRVRETAGRRSVLQTDPVAHSAIFADEELFHCWSQSKASLGCVGMGSIQGIFVGR
jgi:hypothetical protein